MAPTTTAASGLLELILALSSTPCRRATLLHVIGATSVSTFLGRPLPLDRGLPRIPTVWSAGPAAPKPLSSVAKCMGARALQQGAAKVFHEVGLDVSQDLRSEGLRSVRVAHLSKRPLQMDPASHCPSSAVCVERFYHSIPLLRELPPGSSRHLGRCQHGLPPSRSQHIE